MNKQEIGKKIEGVGDLEYASENRAVGPVKRKRCRLVSSICRFFFASFVAAEDGCGCVVLERLSGVLVSRRRHTCSWLLRGSWQSGPRAPWSSILGSQGEMCLTIQRQDPAYRSLHLMAPPTLRMTLRPRPNGKSNTPKKLRRHLPHRDRLLLLGPTDSRLRWPPL